MSRCLSAFFAPFLLPANPPTRGGLRQRLAARFFTHVQGARFYRELHQQAVALLPPGQGEYWVDQGCGPGLVARLAAAHGYRVSGRDLSPAMVAAAAAQPQPAGTVIDYQQAALADPLRGPLAEAGRPTVISAASLLFVLDDRPQALRQLLAPLAHGGTLLLIETTPAMRPAAAWQWLRRHGFGQRGWVLLLWSLARRGRAVSAAELDVPGHVCERVELLDGLVAAWLLRPLPVAAEVVDVAEILARR